MFPDFATKLARILTEYSQPVNPGDYVTIEGATVSEPLIEALYLAVLRRGGHPTVRASFPVLGEHFLTEASDAQLAWIDPTLMTFIEQTDIMYYIFADANTRAFAEVKPDVFAKRQKAMKPFTDTYMRRHAEGSLRWTATGWPTQAAAQEADMGLRGFTEFMYCACGFDRDDPIAYWRGFSERQQRLVEWLTGKSHAQVSGPGVDLSFDFAGRTWVSADGHVNFPDGEIYTGPIEDSVNGTVAFSYPGVLQGRQVEGVRFTYKDGVIVDASASRGEDFLLQVLETDDGARRLGEFAIGTNMGIQRFIGNTLFDEKIGGTIHMAIGFSIPESGGQNQSSIHWDMVHDMKQGGTITIDGELFYDSGKFVVEQQA